MKMAEVFRFAMIRSDSEELQRDLTKPDEWAAEEDSKLLLTAVIPID